MDDRYDEYGNGTRKKYKNVIKNKHTVFLNLKKSFHIESIRLARESMLERLLDLGISYDDFHIVYTYWARKDRWLATLRTNGKPMPQEIYHAVIRTFNQTFPESYRNFLRAPAEVRLIQEAPALELLDPRLVENSCVYAAMCGDMFDHMEFLKAEIDGWQVGIDSDAEALCWPGVSGETGSACIFISLHVEGVPVPPGDSIFDDLRALIRTLPEYRCR
jgi:hypothetical protein